MKKNPSKSSGLLKCISLFLIVIALAVIVHLISVRSSVFSTTPAQPKLYTLKEVVGQVPKGFALVAEFLEDVYSLTPTYYQQDVTGDGIEDIVMITPPEALVNSRYDDAEKIASQGTHFFIFINRGNGQYEKAVDSQTAVPIITDYGPKPCDLDFDLPDGQSGNGFSIVCTRGGTTEFTNTYTFLYNTEGTWELYDVTMDLVSVSPIDNQPDAENPGKSRSVTLPQDAIEDIMIQDFDEQAVAAKFIDIFS